jgi:hypothetical protein
MSRWFQVLFAGRKGRKMALKITELIKFNRFLGKRRLATGHLPEPAADNRGKMPIYQLEI